MDLEYIQTTVPKLHGWCTPEKASHLYNLVLDHENPLCVELGVFAGRSLVAIALGAKAMNGTAVGIDAWSKEACEQGVNDIANTEWWNNINYDFFISKYDIETQTLILMIDTSIYDDDDINLKKNKCL